MSELTDYKAVLLDIEGTVTPVHFVYEELSPYAQRELQSYLESHWNNPHVQEDIEELVEHIAESSHERDGLPDVLDRDQSNVEAFRSAVVEHISWQMEQDKELTPLKRLQQRLWRSGYEEGELEAPVFDDVPEALDAWSEAGVPVYVYSSGSVGAQKLMFEHTDKGDILDYFSGFFDTDTGAKKEAESYRAIADEVGCEPGELLFVTDSLEEAAAARKAGLEVAVSKRPGNIELDEHDFPVIETFDALVDNG